MVLYSARKPGDVQSEVRQPRNTSLVLRTVDRITNQKRDHFAAFRRARILCDTQTIGCDNVPVKARATTTHFQPGRRLVVGLLAAVLLGNDPATAHLLLYENVEVYLDDPERIRIEFTVHAPELPLAVSQGVDPAAVDESWLPGLDDESLRILCIEAGNFIRQTIQIHHPDLESISQLEIDFPDPESLRASPEADLLPAGCLLGTAWLEERRSPAPLGIGFSPSAEKRLLVSIARPSAFPEVHDLGPGEKLSVPLPLPPPPSRAESNQAASEGEALRPFAFLPLPGGLLLVAGGAGLYLLVRRRRRHSA